MTTAILDPTAGSAASPPASGHPTWPACAVAPAAAPRRSGPNFVCAACFGPLEVVYDYDVARERLTREAIAARRAGHLALPRAAARRRAAGARARRRARRRSSTRGPPGRRPRASTGSGSRTTPATRRSASRTGSSRWPSPGRSSSASTRSPAPRPATSPARPRPPRPRPGCGPSSSSRPDLEPAKIDHALAYGATVVRVDGTYDDINRLGLEIADEEGWAFVNVNLRPFYAEGSKTLAFEIAEQLGWRLPDVIVGPIASGSLFTKVAKGFDELVDDRAGRAQGGPLRRRPAGGLLAGGDGVRGGRTRSSRSARPDTIVRSLAIGSPADGGYAIELARRTGGSIEAIADADDGGDDPARRRRPRASSSRPPAA